MAFLILTVDKININMTINKTEVDSLGIDEAKLILAEKRTALAVMRTGIAVLVLPMTVMSFLIATSKYYHIAHVLHFLIPLGILTLALIALGAYLIIRSIIRMHHYYHLILKIKKKYSVIGQFID